KAITAIMLFGVLAPAGANHNNTIIPRVMSQNLYVGADLGRLLAGVPPDEILATIQQTNFPARAVEIARAIDDFNPDLIGLQEVSLIELSDANGNQLLKLDYLAILLGELAARGEHYTVASVVENANVMLPINLPDGTVGLGRLRDSDVILARNSTTKTSNPASANFKDNFDPFGNPALVFTRGYTAVDARVRGNAIRFVNTHLEVEGALCVTKTGPQFCQDLQATELIDAIADEKLPVILVGDFNVDPELSMSTTAYHTIVDAGYLDSWKIRFPFPREPGYTCCQAEDLTNELSQLSTRIDHIFVRESDFQAIGALTTVVGDSKKRKTPGGLWYSDHGGPWAWLILVP
ncbi:MAG: endonuclease/exonuclease/phosphatase family protein, partial [Pseudomonadales bacterium]